MRSAAKLPIPTCRPPTSTVKVPSGDEAVTTPTLPGVTVAGATAVICVGDTTTTSVAASVPNVPI